MSRLFIDTNVPMYAAGVQHPLKEPAQRVIRAIAAGALNAVTDAEVLQEILYRYLHIQQREKAFQISDNFYRIMRGHILPIEDVDVLHARELAGRYAALSPRDLIHLAVMERHQISDIVTTDENFDGIVGIRRTSPDQFEDK
jgi:predicted nucleic acid-binding protein